MLDMRRVVDKILASSVDNIEETVFEEDYSDVNWDEILLTRKEKERLYLESKN